MKIKNIQQKSNRILGDSMKKYEFDAGELVVVVLLVAMAFMLTSLGCEGKPGKDGRAGVDAKTPSILTRPANAQECPIGGVAIQVDSQPPLVVCDGSMGLSGQNGVNGIPGTQITVVQFCPGTTVYPTAFVEVGLCILDEIWAVYSQNNGFITKIPPGTYSSNAVGSSCNFVVKPHCVIQ